MEVLRGLLLRKDERKEEAATSTILSSSQYQIPLNDSVESMKRKDSNSEFFIGSLPDESPTKMDQQKEPSGKNTENEIDNENLNENENENQIRGKILLEDIAGFLRGNELIREVCDYHLWRRGENENEKNENESLPENYKAVANFLRRNMKGKTNLNKTTTARLEYSAKVEGLGGNVKECLAYAVRRGACVIIRRHCFC